MVLGEIRDQNRGAQKGVNVNICNVTITVTYFYDFSL